MNRRRAAVGLFRTGLAIVTMAALALALLALITGCREEEPAPASPVTCVQFASDGSWSTPADCSAPRVVTIPPSR